MHILHCFGDNPLHLVGNHVHDLREKEDREEDGRETHENLDLDTDRKHVHLRSDLGHDAENHVCHQHAAENRQDDAKTDDEEIRHVFDGEVQKVVPVKIRPVQGNQGEGVADGPNHVAVQVRGQEHQHEEVVIGLAGNRGLGVHGLVELGDHGKADIHIHEVAGEADDGGADIGHETHDEAHDDFLQDHDRVADDRAVGKLHRLHDPGHHDGKKSRKARPYHGRHGPVREDGGREKEGGNPDKDQEKIFKIRERICVLNHAPLSDIEGEIRPQGRHIVDNRVQDEGTENHEGNEDGQDLRYEGQGLLLNTRHGLKDGDDETHHQRHKKGRGRADDGVIVGIPHDVENLSFRHDIFSS